jgi:hypothetical protein
MWCWLVMTPSFVLKIIAIESDIGSIVVIVFNNAASCIFDAWSDLEYEELVDCRMMIYQHNIIPVSDGGCGEGNFFMRNVTQLTE